MNFFKKFLLNNSYTKKTKSKYNILSKKLDYIKIQNSLEAISKKKKINVVFIFYFRTSGMDSLINLLNKDNLFNVTVLLLPFKTLTFNVYKEDNKIHGPQLKEYNDNYDYFKSKGFNTVKAYDENTGSLLDMELELMPDIIFYMSPWEGILPIEYRTHNLPQNIIYCYVPYSMYLSKLKNDQFNRPLQKKAWKIFAQSPLHKVLAIKYSSNKGSNVLVTGYPKMDPLIENTENTMPKVWKSIGSEKIRIIWAPHYSIGKDKDVKLTFSTFEDNYKFFYSYAKDNPEIEWVFKPHPKLIYAGERIPNNENFKIENLKDYYEKWNDLPNATVYERGDYLNLFKNSDAMITDSISFLAEYLYADHPGLLLTRPEQGFNEFGEIIKEGWYQVNGKDSEGIKKFIKDVLLEKNDPLKEKREEIYNKYLNRNGVSASQNIYNYLKRTFDKE
ncbi:MAG: CDP-glycerol glycerophosphotransferase family protein [Methanobrevibacter sp.]|jgi:hypothetical protein|nr:CDP-glycerol glycerophosphotransferase family protein [Methanobrevibacter sp.]